MRCFKCNDELEVDGLAKYCKSDIHTVVICNCSHRMIPKNYYSLLLHKFKFFFCPHCFNRW